MPVEIIDLANPRARVSAGLSHICADIRRQFAPAEQAFLEVGDSLRTLCLEAEELSLQASDAATSLGSSVRDSALPEIDRVSEVLVREIVQGSENVESSLGVLHEISRHLGNLAQSMARLRTLGKRLNYTKLYFAIESSRFDVTRTQFASFTDEMAGLGEHVTQTCAQLESGELAVSAEQSRAQAEIAEGLEEMNRLVSSTRATLAETRSSAEGLLGRTSGALVEVASRSDRIRRIVDDTVGALQCQDIVRQQMEHISDALLEAVKELDAGDPGSLVRAQSILRLQTEHVRDAHSVIRDCSDSIANEFRKADEEVSHLASALANIADVRSKGLERGPFDRLVEGLASLAGLQSLAAGLQAKSAESGARAGTACEVLAGHAEDVRLISEEMKVCALNAAVGAARLDERGKTLEVLADQVAQLSASTAGFVTEVVSTIHEIAEASRVLNRSVSRDRDERSRELELLIDSVSAASSDLDQRCASVSSRADILRERISASDVHIRFIEGYRDHLDQIGVEVAKASSDLASLAQGEGVVLDDIAAPERYSMEREREVYRRFSARESPAANKEESLEEGSCILF